MSATPPLSACPGATFPADCAAAGASAAAAAVRRLLAGYEAQAGVADELWTPQGTLRPVWAPFIEQLASLSTAEVAARFARGEQYLRDAGVYFRLYSGGPAQEREWPLSHVPVLIAEAEWHEICAGLTQRAELLEAVMADLYGPARLVAEGHLPAELVAENPQWLRPMVGVTPRSGHFLHHLAFEIGRSPDGSFFVLGDRTQAPSGSGFALENRMATARIFSDRFGRAQVHRLAGFFRAFRDRMEQLSGDGRGLAILTPGPNNDTYYEHTYIARYLGLPLVEGEDLILRDGQAMVRTVAGLEPLGLLWRRIDAEFCDPLELNETSHIGTPGLLEALRRGSLAMINAPGSGVMETRAFMAFYPRICQTLRGEALRMPNIATWWCGQPLERAYVQENAARMMIGDALATGLPFAIRADEALGGRFGPDHATGSGPHPQTIEPGALSNWIAAHGPALVGQEAVTLSTTPAWSDGRLVPRPMTIRVFAARTEAGWTFMPGGYARIGKSDDATALAMQAGGSVADVWVVAPGPVEAETLVGRNPFQRAPPGILPARAADNLYWLGRYVERAEGAIRLVRAWHLRLAETGSRTEPHQQMLADYMAGLGLAPDRPVPAALAGTIASARAAAAKLRDRLSPDGWNALKDLEKTTLQLAAKVQDGDDAAQAMSVLLRKISGFAGLVHENMYHFAGWRFLSMGRAQERALETLRLVRAFTAPRAAPGALEIAIEVGDSVMTHQRRYRFGPSPETVIDLLVHDAQNPRAVHYQIARMREHAAELPGGRETAAAALDGAARDHSPSAFEAALQDLEADLRGSAPGAVDPDAQGALLHRLAALSGLLSDQYLR